MRYAKIAVLALAIAGVAFAWNAGVFAQVGEPRALADRLVAMGAWGFVAFVVAYALLQPFGVPGTVFVIAAPLIWPWPTAFALSMTGTMAASVIGFSFARFVARDWVSTRIPARLRKYDEALERNAFQTVVLLRLLLWMPQVLHWFFGVSKVRFRTHFWGSLIGYIAPLLIVSYLGGEMFDASGRMQPKAWPIMGGMAVASLIIALVARRYARFARTTTSGPSGRKASVTADI